MDTNEISQWKKTKRELRQERLEIAAVVLFLALAFIGTLWAVHENSVVATMVRLSVTTGKYK